MARTYRALWFHLALITILSSTATAQAPVTDDTFVSSATPNSNNGTSPSLVVQAPAGWGFIKFDLSRLPAGTTSGSVTKATVKLYTTAVTAQGAFDLFRVDTAWKEGALTYSNSTAPYQSALSLSLTPITAGLCGTTPVQCVTTTSKYVIVDITSIVKQWLDYQNGVGGFANNGIAFKPSSGSSISTTFESKESTTTSHDSELNIVLALNAGVSAVTASAPLANIGTAANPNIALTGLIPSGNLSGTYSISITGSANTANTATTAISATNATTATNATQLGGIAAANYARVDQANTFSGLNILGNSTAGSGGLTIPPSGTGASKNSFLFNLQSTGASSTNTFAFQASSTPSLNFQFCNTGATCTPVSTGLSIGSNGVITFAPAQTFPSAGSVTNFSAGNLSPLFTTSVSNPSSTPTLSFNLNAQGANTFFAGPTSGSAVPVFRALTAADIPNISESQVTNLSSDLGSKATAASITAGTNTKITYNAQGIVTGGGQAQFSDLGGSVAPSQVSPGTYNININGTATSITGTIPGSQVTGNISGNAASITGSISEGQVTNLPTDLTNLSANIASKVPASAVGVANGVASLDATAHVPSAQLPSLSGTYVDLTSNQSIAGAKTFTGKVDLSGTTVTLPVRVITGAPSPAACSAGQMLFQSDAPVGQQLFVCNSSLDGWVLVTDTSSLSSNLQAAINAETSARQSADANLQNSITAETNRATAAEGTLTTNLGNETAARQSADTTLQSNINAEGTTRAAADTALAVSVATESARAQGAESTLQINIDNVNNAAAKLAGSNTFTADNTFQGQVNAGGASLTIPVRVITGVPVPAVCAVGQMIFQSDAPVGQQLFVCNSSLNGWVLITDTTSLDNSLQAAINAEAAARQAADATLQNNINAETNRVTNAENTITTSLNGEISRAESAESNLQANLNAETATRAVAEANLAASIASETVRATTAETGITTSLNSEISRATTAEETKADLVKPVQLDNAAAANGACAAVNALVLNPTQPSGQQLFVCRDMGGNNLQWQLINDDNSTSAAANAYTDSQIASEAAARAAADTVETNRATTAENAISSNLSSEISRAQATESTITTNLGNEVSRAQVAESTITSNLNNEITRATGAEATLQSNIAAEAATRAAADATLGASIVAESTRAQGAETTLQTNIDSLNSSAAKLNANNTFTANNSFTGKVDLSGSSATLPVQTTNTQPPVSGSPSACVAGQMLLYVAGQPGQQLFICNANLDGWTMVNDDTASSASDHAYTDSQVASEAATRQAADTAEASARQAADATLQNNIDAEATARTAADTAEFNRATTAETSISNSVAVESTRAVTAETALGVAITAEAARATGAEAGITTNLNSEISRATAAEGTKADLVKPVQLDNAAAANGACAAVNALVLNPAQPSGQQLFVCRDMGGNNLQWQLINDDNSTSAAANAYTDSQIASEAAARATADTAETNRATTAENTISSNLSSEISRAQAAESTITTNLSNEVSRAQVAEGTITSNLNNEITRATGAEATLQSNITAEAATRAAADATLGASIVAEGSRAQGAETTLQSNIDSLSSSAAKLSANNTFTGNNNFTGKVDLSGSSATLPVQTTNTQPPVSGSPNACVAGQMLLYVAGQPGQQLFVCNTNLDGWTMVNDDTASSASDHAYTDSQIAAEAAARATADTAETNRATTAENTISSNLNSEITRAEAAESTITTNLSNEVSRAQSAENAITSNVNSEITRATGAEATLQANIGAEATARQAAEAAEALARAAGDAAALSSADAYTDSAVSTINTNLATKANLSGGNSFTGNQTITGNVTVNGGFSLPATGTGPATSQPFDIAGADSGNHATLFRWQVNTSGLLNLFTATGGNSTQDSGLKIGSDGKITFTAGQTFPGTQNTLTAGTGITILTNTISNTGVLTFNGRSGAVSPAASDYSFSQISGTVGGTQLTGAYTGAVTFNNASNAFAGTHSGNGSALTSLSGGSITAASVPNNALANSSLTVTAGTGLSGGGSVALGGSVTLNNAGVTSLTGTANQVSVSSSTGAVTLSLPATINVNTTGNAATATAATAATTAASLSGPFGIPVAVTTSNSGTVTSTSYTASLGGTPGTNPSVTVTVGASGTVMITVTANVATNASNTTDGAAVSFAVSGATSRVAADATSLLVEHVAGNGSPGLVIQGSATFLVTGLTPGSNTFTLQYRSVAGGTQTFSNRSIVVVPY